MNVYKLFTDKNNTFQCKLELEGASLDDATVRIILEGKNNRNYLFEGSMNNSGDCVVNLDKLSDLFKAGDSGNMWLEVVAEDAFFLPWQSLFEVDASKKLRVEVAAPAEVPKKPSIKVEIKNESLPTKEQEFNRLVEFVSNKVKTANVPVNKLLTNKKMMQKINEVTSRCIFEHDVNEVVKTVIKNI